ncbi:MAG: twin-arginine translocase subunit TatC [Elusimicrobia bacterium]|nr:twin-arginine translocase subunit TatC [Elusimicrobiota bacterium]
MPLPPVLAELEPRRDDPPLPLAEHLIELRRRLLVCFAALGAASMLCYRASGWLLDRLAASAGGVVFTHPTEAFAIRIKAALFAGLLVSLPLILHQAWLFVARAFDARLRRLAPRLAAASYLLFLLGAAVAVFAVVPAAMRVLLAFGGEHVRPLMTLSGYLGFAAGLALSFGGVFQLPVVLILLNRMGVVGRRGLRERRRYVYLAAVAAAAVLTPGPDVVSQAALAVPILAIFELTLFFLD